MITASDVARVDAPAPASDAPGPKLAPVPWWGVLIASILAVCLPLLCLFAIGIRVAVRRRDVAVRAAWSGLLCTLLAVSGLVTSMGFAWYVSLGPRHGSAHSPVSVGRAVNLPNLDALGPFPSLPAGHPMSAAEVAQQAQPLVFIVTPDTGAVPDRDYLEYAAVGSGMLLLADDAGYLLGTNRHVVDPPGLFSPRGKAGQTLVVAREGGFGHAQVVGRHRELDLALLWVPRGGARGRFRQPVTAYRAIRVGDPVFVIGHPQRLFFTLSNGLISRLDGANVLQLSAPISPGNSGGPVYDGSGNLLGVVTSKVDRQGSPNAENLNFAIRADAFLSETGWEFRNQGGQRLRAFIEK